MNRLVVFLVSVLASVSLCAQNRNVTVVKGEFGSDAVPNEVTFFYSQDEIIRVPVRNREFVAELPTDITRSYDVSFGRNVEATIVPEGGVLTLGRNPDGRWTVSADRANSLSVRIDSLVSFRRRNYRDSTRMINEYKRVIAANRGNAVSYVALFFLTNFGNTDPKTRFDLANSLDVRMREEPRMAMLRSDIEAVYLTSPGMRFRDFSGTGPQGRTARLSDYAGKGKYILLDFWSTGCGPCRRAFPKMREMFKELGGDKFDIVGVPVWEDASLSREMIREGGLDWANILGTGDAAANLYGVTYVPTYLLIDPDGTICMRGGLAEIERMVRAVLAR